MSEQQPAVGQVWRLTYRDKLHERLVCVTLITRRLHGGGMLGIDLDEAGSNVARLGVESLADLEDNFCRRDREYRWERIA